MIKLIKIFKILTILILFSTPIKSEENNNVFDEHEWNFYSGMFDFSDDGAKSTLIGIQHQNENLTRNSFLGTISPVTGFMFTADNASYVYTGVQAQYSIGKVNIVPSC